MFTNLVNPRYYKNVDISIFLIRISAIYLNVLQINIESILVVSLERRNVILALKVFH